jgi:1,2-phenylacetyl-CoA epoxidase catalytic subunit
MTPSHLDTQISDEDARLLSKIAAGGVIADWQETGGRFKELATSIILQFADSQMAGAAGFADFINQGTSINDRLQISKMVAEKMSMAKLAYDLLAGLNFNSDRYIANHSFQARVLRDTFFGFSRSSADKRLNALLYPLESFDDMLIFTYLLAVMAKLLVGEFADSRFAPLKNLAEHCLPIESSHADLALEMLKKRIPQQREKLQVSLTYWYPRVETSAGPPDSLRNQWHRKFGLKQSQNVEIKETWRKEVTTQLSALEILA